MSSSTLLHFSMPKWFGTFSHSRCHVAGIHNSKTARSFRLHSTRLPCSRHSTLHTSLPLFPSNKQTELLFFFHVLTKSTKDTYTNPYTIASTPIPNVDSKYSHQQQVSSETSNMCRICIIQKPIRRVLHTSAQFFGLKTTGRSSLGISENFFSSSVFSLPMPISSPCTRITFAGWAD